MPENKKKKKKISPEPERVLTIPHGAVVNTSEEEISIEYEFSNYIERADARIFADWEYYDPVTGDLQAGEIRLAWRINPFDVENAPRDTEVGFICMNGQYCQCTVMRTRVESEDGKWLVSSVLLSNNNLIALRSVPDDEVLKGVNIIYGNKINNALACHIAKKRDIVLPRGIRIIDIHNFDWVYSIVIPEGVKYIAPGTFSSANKVYLPDDTEMEIAMFKDCSWLKEVRLPENIKCLLPSLFEGCCDLKRFQVPNSVRTIGESAFEDCIQLCDVVIPDGVTKIHKHAFKGCVKLRIVYIPSSVVEIGEDAFGGVAHIMYRGPARSENNWGADRLN